MNRKSNSWISIILILFMASILWVLPITLSSAGTARRPNLDSRKGAQPHLQLGDFVLFGKYLDESILWRVINIDTDGNPYLFSERVITEKPFDAAEIDMKFYVNGTVADEYRREVYGPSYAPTIPDAELRQHFGSNRWGNSNLRDWLNSNQDQVTFSTFPPIKEAVFEQHNAYADERGFLTNFTLDEQKLIIPVTHRVSLSEADQSDRDGGDGLLTSILDRPSIAVANEATALYEDVTDKMFLLSIQEVSEWVEGRGFEWKKMVTEAARQQANGFVTEANGIGGYWLRTPNVAPDKAYCIRGVTPEGIVDFDNGVAFGGAGGVAPAFVLDGKAAGIGSGSGILEDPYVLSFTDPASVTSVTVESEADSTAKYSAGTALTSASAGDGKPNSGIPYLPVAAGIVAVLSVAVGGFFLLNMKDFLDFSRYMTKNARVANQNYINPNTNHAADSKPKDNPDSKPNPDSNPGTRQNTKGKPKKKWMIPFLYLRFRKFTFVMGGNEQDDSMELLRKVKIRFQTGARISLDVMDDFGNDDDSSHSLLLVRHPQKAMRHRKDVEIAYLYGDTELERNHFSDEKEFINVKQIARQ